MIAQPDVPRALGAIHWRRNGLLFALAAALSSVTVGSILGGVGAIAPLPMRVALGALVALLGVVLAGSELSGVWRRVLQCDRETPRQWLERGARYGAIRNGLALGHGASTRIGFWAWYAIPFGALLLGNPLYGALIYGSYGATRGVLVWGWVALRSWKIDAGSDVTVWVLAQQTRARRLAALQLLLTCAATVAAIG